MVEKEAKSDSTLIIDRVFRQKFKECPYNQTKEDGVATVVRPNLLKGTTK